MATWSRCKYLILIGVSRIQLGGSAYRGQRGFKNFPTVRQIQPSLCVTRSQSTSASSPANKSEQGPDLAVAESDSENHVKPSNDQSTVGGREGLIKYIHSKLITSIKDESISETDKETIVKDSIQRLLSLGNARGSYQFTNHALEHFVDRKLGSMEFAMFLDLLQFYLQQTNNMKMKELLLHEALWRLNKCSMSEMFKIAKLVASDRSAKGQEIIQVCCERVRTGTKDILTSQDLGMAIKLMRGQRESPETVELLEETAFFFLTSMNSSQLCNLLYFMACHRTKNSILRKAVVREITKQKLSVTVTQLPDLFFSCAVLNVHNENLLKEMSDKVVAAVKTGKIVKQNQLYQILDACSKLGWRYQPLIDSVMENIDSASVSEKRLASAVISLAKLDISGQSELVQSVLERLSGLESSDPRMFVSVVHAVASLGEGNQQLMQSVLTPTFYSSLLAETKSVPGFVQDLVRQKLLHILGSLRLDYSVSDASLLPEASDWIKQLQAKLTSRAESVMMKDIGRFLRGISVREDHVTIRQARLDPYGNKIDFEVVSKSKESESSPSGKRVLIRLLSFDDMLMGGQEIVPNGFTATSLRQLAADGDTVVMIPYFWEKKQWEEKLGEIFKQSEGQDKS